MSSNKTDKSADRMIYACAGVANTGYLADRVARYWMQSGEGRMSCLAAIGAGTKKFIDEASTSKENVVIDGCPIACGRRIFEAQGLSFRHLTTTDFGVVKGETEISDSLVHDVADRMLKEAGSLQER